MEFKIGYIGSKLYRLGWRSSIHQDLSWEGHLLLSIFLYYRRGYSDGSEWMAECDLEASRR
ncbi:MAG: hypothetical protein KME17_03385 [Cyanosarcina radialis HA8281-LM2]|jgi:hypothetical protein|nr:hypothetical protein [Cyanosarcina radialis HA8281-LM2]